MYVPVCYASYVAKINKLSSVGALDQVKLLLCISLNFPQLKSSNILVELPVIIQLLISQKSLLV